MSAIRAASAFVELTLQQSAFRRGLSNAERNLASSAAKMRKIGGVILGAGTALATPFIAGIRAASRMEETMAKFEVVFGEASGSVKKWSDTFANRVGRSRQQIADFLASSQDLFIPLGFDEQKATQLSQTLTSLSVDLASFNNKSDADAQRDLQSALTGSSEVMKKYGVIVNEAAVKQQLLNDGFDPKVATDQQKVLARLNIILAGTAAAQGDAVRSGSSFANQWKRLQGNIDDAFSAIGQAILPTVSKVVESINVVVGSISNWLRLNSGLVRASAGVVLAIIAAGAAILGLGVAISAGLTAFGLMASAVGALSAVLGGIATIATAVGAAVVGFIVSPIGLTIVAITAAVAAFLVYTEAGQNLINFFTQNFGQIFEVVSQTIGGIVNALNAGQLALAAEIGFRGMQVAILSVLNAITGDFRVFVTTLTSVLTQTIGSLANQIGSLLQFAGFDDTKLKVFAASLNTGIQTGVISGLKNLDISEAKKKLEELKGAASQESEVNGFFDFKKIKADLEGVQSQLPSLDFDFKVPEIALGQVAFGKGTRSQGTFLGGAAAGLGGGSFTSQLLSAQKQNQKNMKRAEEKQQKRDADRDGLLRQIVPSKRTRV